MTGNINQIFNQSYKLYWIEFEYLKYDDSSGHYNGNYTSTDISGNINAFADKYDLEYLLIARYPNITGQVKDLKNLKKIYAINLAACSCTGSKTDLWNQGANITIFYV